MTKREKIRRKLRNNPQNVTMQEVETFLLRYGFFLARVTGSHHIFEHGDGKYAEQIVIPAHGRKVKKIYVEQITIIIDKLYPVEQADEDEEPADE